jgi:hypothetical protein
MARRTRTVYNAVCGRAHALLWNTSTQGINTHAGALQRTWWEMALKVAFELNCAFGQLEYIRSIFMKMDLCSFIYGDDLYKLWKPNRNRASFLWGEGANLFWESFEGFLLSELECSFSPDTGLGWIHIYIGTYIYTRGTKTAFQNHVLVLRGIGNPSNSREIFRPTVTIWHFPNYYYYYLFNCNWALARWQ